MLEHEEMVDNLVAYFKKHNIKVNTEFRTHFGPVDMFLPELEVVIEVKKDDRDLHSALGQLLTYQRGIRYHAFSNPKLVLIYQDSIPDRWYDFFHDYNIMAFSYYAVVEDNIAFTKSAVDWKETITA